MKMTETTGIVSQLEFGFQCDTEIDGISKAQKCSSVDVLNIDTKYFKLQLSLCSWIVSAVKL